MKIDQFGEFKTGTLVHIRPEGRFDDYAFVPNPLPTSWMPDRELWPLIAEARDRVATLNGTGGILPNPTLLLSPLQRREAIKSNSIEGTYVKAEEYLLFEAEQDKAKDGHNVSNSDWNEVFCYMDALSYGCDRIAQGTSIDRSLFCDLHKILMERSRGSNKTPGYMRGMQVYVEAGRRYIPPPPDKVSELMDNLEAYLAGTHCDPLVAAFIAHYQFEAIHPFQDGNGRLGRLILSLCIYKWLAHSHAWLYLSEFFDANRREYITRLFTVSTSGEWEEWVRFCLQGAIRQAESAIRTCKKLEELKKKYHDSVGHLSSRMHSIIEMLLSEPIIETHQLAKRLKVHYNTAKSDVDKLVERGVLEQLKISRKTFCAHELFDAAYLD